jgi:hypothetical protein
LMRILPLNVMRIRIHNIVCYHQKGTKNKKNGNVLKNWMFSLYG